MSVPSIRKSAARFNVVMTSGFFEPGFRAGGPIRSVARILDTAPEGIGLTLLTSDRDTGESTPYPNLSGQRTTRGAATIHYINTRSLRHWIRTLRQLRTKRIDLLYVNSLWLPTFSILPILAASLKVLRVSRLLVAPRGELSPGALELKGIKKRIMLKAWVPLLERMDTVWHASTELEASDIRSVCPGAVIEVVEDQTDLPIEAMPAKEARQGPTRFVFISRISRMKNLDLVLRGFKTLSKPAVLDIFGPIEDTDYWTECQEVIATLPSHLVVQYCGELPASAVRTKFSEYDAFAFPTRGENFGHVIAESLSASCPVICSDQTPWTNVLVNGGGVVVDAEDSAPLARALSALAAQTPFERLAARHAAGAAYAAWRTSVTNENILARMLYRTNDPEILLPADSAS